jgi:hypothetical protein
LSGWGRLAVHEFRENVAQHVGAQRWQQAPARIDGSEARLRHHIGYFRYIIELVALHSILDIDFPAQFLTENFVAQTVHTIEIVRAHGAR